MLLIEQRCSANVRFLAALLKGFLFFIFFKTCIRGRLGFRFDEDCVLFCLVAARGEEAAGGGDVNDAASRGGAGGGGAAATEGGEERGGDRASRLNAEARSLPPGEAPLYHKHPAEALRPESLGKLGSLAAVA